MTDVQAPAVFGTGLIALDLVVSLDSSADVKASAGGSCGNVLSILAYLGWSSFPIARLNGDAASQRVRADFRRWKVQLKYVSCGPSAHTPIIVQERKVGRDGKPRHRFTWSCPQCGEWLPAFKPVTRDAIDIVSSALNSAKVFFLDRLSSAAIALAEKAASNGALVVFEPSGRSTDKLRNQAFRVSHIVKYSDQRIGDLPGVFDGETSVLVEIQTLGEEGLRYRHRLGRSKMHWLHLDAVAAPELVDTCGSGDWCTAGLIATVGRSGQQGLEDAGASGLRSALKYGQALAAWNCGFEGARGGMYGLSKDLFDEQIAALTSGRERVAAVPAVKPVGAGLVPCPSCPPELDR